jgi:hypothetical protein
MTELVAPLHRGFAKPKPATKLAASANPVDDAQKTAGVWAGRRTGRSACFMWAPREMNR